MSATRRALAVTVWLGACGPGLAPAHLLPVASVPFDPYGGAIYVPAVVNDDSALLMFDTGLSRTGFDRDWARTIGLPDSTSFTLVRRLQLGNLELADFRAALYRSEERRVGKECRSAVWQ